MTLQGLIDGVEGLSKLQRTRSQTSELVSLQMGPRTLVAGKLVLRVRT